MCHELSHLHAAVTVHFLMLFWSTESCLQNKEKVGRKEVKRNCLVTKTWWHELCWQTAVYLGNHKTYQKPLCCFKNVIPQCDVFTFTTTTLTTHIDFNRNSVRSDHRTTNEELYARLVRGGMVWQNVTVTVSAFVSCLVMLFFYLYNKWQGSSKRQSCYGRIGYYRWSFYF